MKGDFSRDTFDKANDFLRVMMQQGRVHIDADWNEQVAILLDYMRTLAVDFHGKYRGNAFKLVFIGVDNAGDDVDLGEDNVAEDKITEILLMRQKDKKFEKLTARLEDPDSFYYVNGFRCRGSNITLWKSDAETRPKQSKLYFLDVWERHITYQENDSIREKALGGADTSSRSKIVWMPRERTVKDLDSGNKKLEDLRALNEIENRGRLSVRLGDQDETRKKASPASKFRGSENQLYRVEIHSSGTLGSDGSPNPTWKWATNNASLAFPVRKFSGQENETIAEVEHLGRGSIPQLKVGDFVELVDDDVELADPHLQVRTTDPADTEQANTAPLILQVKEVNANEYSVTLDGSINKKFEDFKNPLLRKWNSTELIVADDKPFPLENGIVVQFHKAADDQDGTTKAGQFVRGDYWLIPARTTDGSIEWPQSGDTPSKQHPRVVNHHYAPLALMIYDAGEFRCIDKRN